MTNSNPALPETQQREGADAGKEGPTIKVLACHKVRVNGGGYDWAGRYWGTGAPLYYIEFADGRNGHVRASSRKDAIATAIEKPAYWGIQ